MKTHVITMFFSVLLVSFLFVSAKRNDQQTFDKITVREFELVGEDGNRRASIKVEPGGEVVLRMMDKTGTIRVKLGAGEDGSGLVLLDDSTEPGIQALAKKEGGKLVLQDRNRMKREL